MGGAIIWGIRSGYGDNAEIYAYDPDREKLSALEREGVKAAASEGEVCRLCKYVFLAVKPQVFDTVLPKLADSVTGENVIVSIAAGITEDYICKMTCPEAHVVIVMPNTPFLLGKGAAALAKGRFTTDEEFETVMDIFRTGEAAEETAGQYAEERYLYVEEFEFAKKIIGSCGIAEVVPMDKMKEVIALNGSSPAFIYLYAKGFIDYAQSVGIDSETALRLFAQSLVGSAAMMTSSGKSIDELIKMVSSPGGTTLAGLDGLYEGKLTEVVHDCCERCTKRAYELSK